MYMRFRQQWATAKLKALLADGLGRSERRLARATQAAYNRALVQASRCASLPARLALCRARTVPC